VGMAGTPSTSTSMPAAVSAAATPVVGDFGASDDSDVWQPAMTDDGNVYYFHKVCCVRGVCARLGSPCQRSLTIADTACVCFLCVGVCDSVWWHRCR
jgi:hypothetical protein